MEKIAYSEGMKRYMPFASLAIAVLVILMCGVMIRYAYITFAVLGVLLVAYLVHQNLKSRFP
jgi:hypothetical protein